VRNQAQTLVTGSVSDASLSVKSLCEHDVHPTSIFFSLSYVNSFCKHLDVKFPG